jgi:hypothetical protein
MKNKLVDIIYQALRRYQVEIGSRAINDTYNDARIHDVSLWAGKSCGSDHKSSEVIITLDDGEQKKDFVISNNDIREITLENLVDHSQATAKEESS